MRCPKCGSLDDRVVESRSSGDGVNIRRRRECLRCETRFTTYETIFHERMRVKKRGGEYEEFDPRKLREGLEKACEKRPVSSEQIDGVVEQITTELENDFGREATSLQIGEIGRAHV